MVILKSRRSVGTPQRERLVFLCGRGFHSGCYLSVFHPRIIWLEEDAQATPVRRGETACYFMLPPPLPPPALYPPCLSPSRVESDAECRLPPLLTLFFTSFASTAHVCGYTAARMSRVSRNRGRQRPRVFKIVSVRRCVSSPGSKGTLVAFPFTF